MKRLFFDKENELLNTPKTKLQMNDSVEDLAVREPEMQTGDIGTQADFDKSVLDAELDQAEESLPMYEDGLLNNESQDDETNQAIVQPETNTVTPISQEIKSEVFNPLAQNTAIPKQNQYNNILENYKRLKNSQLSQADTDFNANLLQAGNKAAQAIAYGRGAKIDDGKDLADSIRKSGANLISSAEGMVKYGNEQELADPASDISGFYREQAKSLLMKLYPNRSEQELDSTLADLSALQISKIPGLKSMLGSPNAKRNSQVVTYTDPETRKIMVGLIDRENGEMIKTMEAGGLYGQQLDPTTGDLVAVSKTDPFRKPITRGESSRSNVINSSDKNTIKNVGDYRREGLIAPKEWDNIVTKDKEGFEVANRQKLQIISSLDSARSLAKLATKNSQTAASLGGIIGAIFEPGKLTDEDAKRYVQQMGISKKLKNWLSQEVQGVITQDLADEIIQTANGYKDAMDRTVRENAVKYAAATKNALVNSDKVDPDVLADFYYTRNNQKLVDQVIVTKNGKKQSIPKENLKKAQERGWELVK